jgi:hypothetical protein
MNNPIEFKKSAMLEQHRWVSRYSIEDCHLNYLLLQGRDSRTRLGVPTLHQPLSPPALKMDQESIFKAEMNASCGISTFPNWRIFFLPFFCFSKSFFLRVASPP